MVLIVIKLIADFAAAHKRVIVIEELDGLLSTLQISRHQGGWQESSASCGEYTRELLSEKLLGIKASFKALDETMPNRPPVLVRLPS